MSSFITNSGCVRTLLRASGRLSASGAPMRDTSPAAVDNFTEQIFLLARWRAPVRRRSEYLSTALGSGMPGPAGVIEHSACQRDHVRLDNDKDVLRLLWVGDQTDCHRGQSGRGLDGLCERNLVARRGGGGRRRGGTA